MPTYEWRSAGGKPPVDADVFADEVRRIANADPLQLIDVDLVWQAARNPHSPIHNCWDWDTATAAEHHWRDHTRHLLRQLVPVRVITRAGETVSGGKALYNVTIQNRRGYVFEERILGDQDLKVQIIRSSKRELETFLAKFAQNLRFGHVIARLQQAINEIQDEIDRLEAEAIVPRTSSPSPTPPPPPTGRGPRGGRGGRRSRQPPPPSSRPSRGGIAARG